MSFIKSLTPHLAETMPMVAGLVPWLLLLDALIIVGSHVAAFCLIRSYTRMAVLDAATRRPQQALEITGILRFRRTLTRARRSLLLVALLFAMASGIGALYGFGPEWIELTLGVLALGVLFPQYFAVRILELASRRIVECWGPGGDIVKDPADGRKEDTPSRTDATSADSAH